jgi:hypothetical protein
MALEEMILQNFFELKSLIQNGFIDENQKIVTIQPTKRYHIKFISELLGYDENTINSRIKPINELRPSYFSGESVLFLLNVKSVNKKGKKIQCTPKKEIEMFEKMLQINNA